MSKQKLELTDGTLFYNFNRFSMHESHKHIDRIPSILKHGIVAPAFGRAVGVIQECPIKVTGLKYPYNELVFVHLFRTGISELYLMHFDNPPVMLILDEDFEVMHPEEMGEGWITLSQSEVYVHKLIKPERIKGIVLQPEIIESVVSKHEERLRELGILVWNHEGDLYWSP